MRANANQSPTTNSLPGWSAHKPATLPIAGKVPHPSLATKIAAIEKYQFHADQPSQMITTSPRQRKIAAPADESSCCELATTAIAANDKADAPMNPPARRAFNPSMEWTVIFPTGGSRSTSNPRSVTARPTEARITHPAAEPITNTNKARISRSELPARICCSVFSASRVCPLPISSNCALLTGRLLMYSAKQNTANRQKAAPKLHRQATSATPTEGRWNIARKPSRVGEGRAMLSARPWAAQRPSQPHYWAALRRESLSAANIRWVQAFVDCASGSPSHLPIANRAPADNSGVAKAPARQGRCQPA